MAGVWELRMLLFAQEGLERMGGPQSTDQTESPGDALEQVLQHFEGQFSAEDYAPGLSDLVRLILFRRDLEESGPVTLLAGWVRKCPT